MQPTDGNYLKTSFTVDGKDQLPLLTISVPMANAGAVLDFKRVHVYITDNPPMPPEIFNKLIEMAKVAWKYSLDRAKNKGGSQS